MRRLAKDFDFGFVLALLLLDEAQTGAKHLVRVLESPLLDEGCNELVLVLCQDNVSATPHDLRHYFASVQIRGGPSIKVLQALLGHKSAVETWDSYGHLMGDEDDRSRAVVDAALVGAGGPQDDTKGQARPESLPQ